MASLPLAPAAHSVDAWNAGIAAALSGEGLRLALQPIIDIANARTAGYEVLSRFAGPPEGTPDVWFAKALELGCAPELDAAVIRRALLLLDEIPGDRFITINVDPAHLSLPPVQEALRERPLGRVVIELTEHQRISDYGAIRDSLAPLRDAGAKVAIDDAGNGYAGLQWLMALSPDLIKFDRALIDGIDSDEVKIALVTMLGHFADRIDAWVLAEGVERHAELDTIMRLGIPLAQGFLLARPSFERWPDLDGDALAHIVARRAQRSRVGGSVAGLVETVSTHSGGEPHATASEICVVVDDDARPVTVCLPDRTTCTVLAVRVDDAVAGVLARAVTRSPEHRWMPVVCVTDAREVVGIIRMERLIEHLLNMAHAHDADADAELHPPHADDEESG